MKINLVSDLLCEHIMTNNTCEIWYLFYLYYLYSWNYLRFLLQLFPLDFSVKVFWSSCSSLFFVAYLIYIPCATGFLIFFPSSVNICICLVFSVIQFSTKVFDNDPIYKPIWPHLLCLHLLTCLKWNWKYIQLFQILIFCLKKSWRYFSTSWRSENFYQ